VDEKKPVDIPLPPRRLTPQLLRRLRREGRNLRLAGVIFIALGLCAGGVTFLDQHSKQRSLKRSPATTVGTVTQVEQEAAECAIVRYTFTIDMGTFRGWSALDGTTAFRVGDEVTVEYVPGSPAFSRMAGARRPVPLAFLPALVALPFVFVGCIPLAQSARRRARRLRVLRYGIAAAGTVTRIAWLAETKSAWAYQIRYTFLDETGRRRASSYRTLLPPFSLSFDEGSHITVLYDRRSPRRSVVGDLFAAELEGRPDTITTPRASSPTALVPPPPRNAWVDQIRPYERRIGRLAFTLLLLLLPVFGLSVGATIWQQGWPDLLPDIRLSMHHGLVQGTVTSVRQLRARRVRIDYEYELPDGAPCTGRSYVDGLRSAVGYTEGDSATVEYQPSRPDESRIKGMRRGEQALWQFLALVCAPPLLLVLWVAFVVWGLVVSRQRTRQVVRFGVVAQGVVLTVTQPANAAARRRRARAVRESQTAIYTVIRCRYADERRREHETTAGFLATRGASPLNVGDPVTVLYDPKRPKRAFVVEAFPFASQEARAPND